MWLCLASVCECAQSARPRKRFKSSSAHTVVIPPHGLGSPAERPNKQPHTSMSRKASQAADDDDELEPYEVMALENQSKQNGKRIKETKQTTLNFKKLEASDDDDDDDDDDELSLGAFSFKQHVEAAPKEAKIHSALTVTGGDAKPSKKRKPEEPRIKLRDRWPRGKRPLPEGWEATEYRNGPKGKEYWVFSHAYYGETKDEERCRRPEEEWKEELQKKSGGKKGSRLSIGSGGGSQDLDRRMSGASEAGASDGGGSSGGGADEDGNDDDGDDLLALLNKKRKKEEQDEATREKVHEEMRLRMDTGVRVNPALKKMLSK